MVTTLLMAQLIQSLYPTTNNNYATLTFKISTVGPTGIRYIESSSTLSATSLYVIKEKLSKVISSMQLTQYEIKAEMNSDILSVSYIPTIPVPLSDANKEQLCYQITEGYNTAVSDNYYLELNKNKEENIKDSEENAKGDKTVRIENISSFVWNRETGEMVIKLNKEKKEVGQKENFSLFRFICSKRLVCYNSLNTYFPKIENIENSFSYTYNLLDKVITLGSKLVYIGVGLCSFVTLHRIATYLTINRRLAEKDSVLAIFGKLKYAKIG